VASAVGFKHDCSRMALKLPSAERVHVVDWNLLQTMPADNDWFAGKACLIPETALIECIEKTGLRASGYAWRFENWILKSSANIYWARDIYKLFKLQHAKNRSLHRGDLIDPFNTRGIRTARRNGVLGLTAQINAMRSEKRLIGMKEMREWWVKYCEAFSSEAASDWKTNSEMRSVVSGSEKLSRWLNEWHCLKPQLQWSSTPYVAEGAAGASSCRCPLDPSPPAVRGGPVGAE